ncbi:MAG TPA: heme lyase CcmF/NrfE family subunit [Bryobacteraceae bacterium]|jgi:cytochrome c-type biogenesis protein CcmF|nr:heme lyase CcmF/NrfE family subunit [Bryobacteraceae bacterium]
MENLGTLAILLAFCFAIYAVIGSVAGKLGRRPFLVLSAERAVYCVWALLTVAASLLVYSLIAGDFRLSYVAEHSNKSMDLPYKFASWWGGQEGSLLLWSWLLATYTSVVVFQNRRKFREMMPYVTAVLMTTEAFFLTLISFVEPPFKVLMAGKGIVDAGDGQGLNPLLQYWTMVIHPPMLYLGYVGFAVPFAFAMGSLITKQPGDGWINTTRRWTLVTWMFQTTGVLLGAGWAYAVLGWGGYWGWDPVENASLLPWITATAFLHSVMMQEKKGMMKVWNMVLVSSTFFLCIFGTFLTRSGVVQSVHAFAQSSLGRYFVTFLAVGIAATLYLILNRLDYLKSEAQLESVLSRESSFLFNNLILLASCFAVLWGTLFPVITEAINGEKISVDAPFFNRVNIPIGLFLMLLTGVGPLIAWRKSSVESLKRAFFWPTIAGLAVVVALFVMGVRHFYALVSFALCTFVAVTVVIEFFKGAIAIRSKDGQNLLASMVELTHRNTRRYGGYLVHMGVVFMFIGFTGKAFDLDKTVQVSKGDKVQLGAYQLTIGETESGKNENYSWDILNVGVTKNGSDLGTLRPERRLYFASRQPTSNVAIRRRLNEDLYLNFAGASNDGEGTVLQSYVFPLVSWIWIGYWGVLIGTIICLIPSKSRLVYPRTEVVTVAGKHAQVEK